MSLGSVSIPELILRSVWRHTKHRRAESLIEKGVDIQILSETDSCKLVGVETPQGPHGLLKSSRIRRRRSDGRWHHSGWRGSGTGGAVKADSHARLCRPGTRGADRRAAGARRRLAFQRRRATGPTGGGILFRAADLCCAREAALAVSESALEGSPVSRLGRFLIGSLPVRKSGPCEAAEEATSGTGWVEHGAACALLVRDAPHQNKEGSLPTPPAVDLEWGRSVQARVALATNECSDW